MIAAAVGLGAVTIAGGHGLSVAWMPGNGGPVSGNTISLDRAVDIAQQRAAGYSSRTLTVDEVMEFQNNFYASIKEKDSGIGAFEILINRFSGAVSPELGPNMIWNTAYGMMGRGGMMGVAQPDGAMTVSKENAATIAQSWLDRHLKGATTRTADPFYGYYTIDFEKGGKLVGMLSVNGYSGQVWLHTWHGTFIQSKDLGK